MPTLMTVGPYRFFVYMYDLVSGEPPHVHVKRDGNEVKFWLKSIDMHSNSGFTDNELKKIEKIVKKNQKSLLKRWNNEQRKANAT